MIRMFGGLISNTYAEDNGGRLHLIDPFVGDRVNPPPLGYNAVEVVFSLAICLQLWSDEPGKPFKLSVALVYPPDDDRDLQPIVTQDYVWPETHGMTITLKTELHVAHKVSGFYFLRFLAKGEPLGELSFPLFWLNDLPNS